MLFLFCSLKKFLTVANTEEGTSPEYNESFDFLVPNPPTGFIECEVYNDNGGRDELIGNARLPLEHIIKCGIKGRTDAYELYDRKFRMSGKAVILFLYDEAATGSSPSETTVTQGTISL
jgi:hypothetical protein